MRPLVRAAPTKLFISNPNGKRINVDLLHKCLPPTIGYIVISCSNYRLDRTTHTYVRGNRAWPTAEIEQIQIPEYSVYITTVTTSA